MLKGTSGNFSLIIGYLAKARQAPGSGILGVLTMASIAENNASLSLPQ